MPDGTTMSFTEIFSWISEGLEMILSLCTTFPLNIYVGASVIGIGIVIYKSLKH